MKERRDLRSSKSSRNQLDFQPVCSIHFGGVWEQKVRGCKNAVYTVLGNRSVTDDSLSTTMCIVEETFNARSMAPGSSDNSDLEALNPKRFLT